jgi:hypothetical protein
VLTRVSRNLSDSSRIEDEIFLTEREGETKKKETGRGARQGKEFIAGDEESTGRGSGRRARGSWPVG